MRTPISIVRRVTASFSLGDSQRATPAPVSLPVQTTPDADAQIREIDVWWQGNRAAAPNLFYEELTASFDVIGHTPQIGRLYRQSPVPGVRRILLKASRYRSS